MSDLSLNSDNWFEDDLNHRDNESAEIEPEADPEQEWLEQEEERRIDQMIEDDMIEADIAEWKRRQEQEEERRIDQMIEDDMIEQMIEDDMIEGDTP